MTCTHPAGQHVLFLGRLTRLAWACPLTLTRQAAVNPHSMRTEIATSTIFAKVLLAIVHAEIQFHQAIVLLGHISLRQPRALFAQLSWAGVPFVGDQYAHLAGNRVPPEPVAGNDSRALGAF